MKHPLRATLAAAALLVAAPAAADIIQANPSGQNGTTVHNDTDVDGTTVLGELGLALQRIATTGAPVRMNVEDFHSAATAP